MSDATEQRFVLDVEECLDVERRVYDNDYLGETQMGAAALECLAYQLKKYDPSLPERLGEQLQVLLAGRSARVLCRLHVAAREVPTRAFSWGGTVAKMWEKWRSGVLGVARNLGWTGRGTEQ